MITAIVLYDLPNSIGLAECRQPFTKTASDFLKAPGFLRKQFICRKEGHIAGGVYMWESRAAAEAFYSGPWREGIRARYGNDQRIQYFESIALTTRHRPGRGIFLLSFFVMAERPGPSTSRCWDCHGPGCPDKAGHDWFV
jgi:hypothetical protein